LQLGVDERQTSLKTGKFIHGAPSGLRTLLLDVVRSCSAQLKNRAAGRAPNRGLAHCGRILLHSARPFQPRRGDLMAANSSQRRRLFFRVERGAQFGFQDCGVW
jgi:hypothetical protein